MLSSRACGDALWPMLWCVHGAWLCESLCFMEDYSFDSCCGAVYALLRIHGNFLLDYVSENIACD